MSVSLYRKYRPRLFREVAGQDTAVGVLRASYAGRRLGHAYLFSGPRGCGKTTAARLLAKIVNCQSPTDDGEPCCVCESCASVSAGNHMDVMEIDGASNRGIDQIRELKSHVGLAPFMGGSKVYILDEVHMLTQEAFNALLKTLEEPPPSVMFVFATTEPHKVPVTIRSRCQHIPFHRISIECIAAQLRLIAEAEGARASDQALWEISRSADGAMRDAISLFEQAVAISCGDVSRESVRALLGGGSRAETERWVTMLRERPDAASASLKETLDLGVSPERFLNGLFPLLRDMWAFGLWGESAFAGMSLSAEEKDFLKTEVPNWSADTAKRAAMAAAALIPRARLGIGSEVFSGLLLLEMLNAFETPDTNGGRTHDFVGANCVRPASDIRPALRVPPTLDVPLATDETPATGLNEILARIAREDLPTAAALIDVRVTLDGDSMKPDFTGAAKTAEATLSGARAAAAMEGVFGPTAIGSDGESRTPPQRTPAADAPSSLEAVSAKLGADILMSRRLEADDRGPGSIEDEQF